MRRAVIGTMLAASVFGTLVPGSPRGVWAQTPAQTAPAVPVPAPAVPVPAAPVASAPPAVPTPSNSTPGNSTPGNSTPGNSTPGNPTPGNPTAGSPTAGSPTLGIPTLGIPTLGKPTLGKPTISIDLSELPPLPPVVPADERRQAALIATGAGAAIGILVADILTGGVLLAPLGLPSASTFFSAEPAVAAAAPAGAVAGVAPAAIAGPTYSLAQQLLAGVASFAAAVGGGYVGSYVARAHPDLVGLPE
jgi:hypothetical protein